uniref:Peptidase metallopeptidase domain-containing protein n=1 Tax=Cyclopterus lumpus TaxID=8103 RepID=A0A8C2ZIA1_CYCLU
YIYIYIWSLHVLPVAAWVLSGFLPQSKDMLQQGYLGSFYNRSPTAECRGEGSDPCCLPWIRRSFFGLKETGGLDPTTLDVMKEPRCGVPDVENITVEPVVPPVSRLCVRLWRCRIAKYTPDVKREDVERSLRSALKLWSEARRMWRRSVFSVAAHGDLFPFDGPRGVLAHAYEPGKGLGDTHFDDDERWTFTQRGVNLLLVAAHEFGHALGLDHSRDRGALMYPTYRYVNTNGYRLPDDDKHGVQALYDPGPEPEEPTEDPNPDPLPNPRGEQCSRGLVFDAATSISGTCIRNYIFYHFNFNILTRYYWRKSTTATGIRFTKVNTKWSQINYVDAAFEVPSKDTVITSKCFSAGRQYWGIRAYAKTVISGFPKSLTNLGLPSSVSKVDAAVYVPTTRKTLIFVNNQYWRRGRNQMDVGYPRYITQDFPGIGSKVDAAFENYGYLYFSDGPRQSEYYLPYRRVMRVLLNYGWLNCY